MAETAQTPPKQYKRIQRVTGTVICTHEGFVTDEYHTYEYLKVEVKPKKAKKKLVVEAPVKERTPSPKTVEKEKQFSTKVAKMKSLAKQVDDALGSEGFATRKVAKKRKALPSEEELAKQH